MSLSFDHVAQRHYIHGHVLCTFLTEKWSSDFVIEQNNDAEFQSRLCGLMVR